MRQNSTPVKSRRPIKPLRANSGTKKNIRAITAPWRIDVIKTAFIYRVTMSQYLQSGLRVGY
jgi:hypothetical protein